MDVAQLLPCRGNGALPAALRVLGSNGASPAWGPGSPLAEEDQPSGISHPVLCRRGTPRGFCTTHFFSSFCTEGFERPSAVSSETGGEAAAGNSPCPAVAASTSVPSPELSSALAS